MEDSLLIYKLIKNKMPNFVFECMEVIDSAGGESYLVGGCIRDLIIYGDKYQPEDIDLACSFDWKTSKTLLLNKGWSVIETGIAHGTITALPPKPMRNNLCVSKIEITTYRVDGAYTDNRHPDKIYQTSSINEDLKRRDFTINALAWNNESGLIDNFGGLQDIKDRRIKTVGDPDIRFEEDALRMLRALRFSAKLNFSIESSTLQSIYKNSKKLCKVSSERIRDELTKTISSPYSFISLQKYPEIIVAALPELKPLVRHDHNSICQSDDIYIHTIKVLHSIDWACKYLNYKPSASQYSCLKWAALLHDISKPACASAGKSENAHYCNHPSASVETSKSIFKRLHFSNKSSAWITGLIKYHDHNITNNQKEVLKFLQKLSNDISSNKEIEFLKNLLVLKVANTKEHAVKYNPHKYLETLNILNQIIEKNITYKTYQLAINGHDLINIGIPEGPLIKDILNLCLEQVLNNSVNNTKTDLIKLVKVKYQQNIETARR